MLIVNDETERFNAEERFERAFSANPAPAIIARLSDMRYVRVNRGFLELTGLRAGRPGRPLDPRFRRPGGSRAARPGRQAAARGRDDPADGGMPGAAGRAGADGAAGRPADRDRRRGLHAVHLRRPAPAADGPARPEAQRGALLQGVPHGAGPDGDPGAGRVLHQRRERRLHRRHRLAREEVLGRGEAELGCGARRDAAPGRAAAPAGRPPARGRRPAGGKDGAVGASSCPPRRRRSMASPACSA